MLMLLCVAGKKVSKPGGAGNIVIPGYDKVLLQGVSGYAKPGTLTALMGASGAGT